MTVENITKLFQNKDLKKGRFYNIVIMDTDNGYVKTTKMVGRFVNYYHKKVVIAEGKEPKPLANSVVIIPNVLSYNCNTQKYYMACNSVPNSKAITEYKDPNGQIIDKDTYYQATNKKPSKPSHFYRITLDKVVSINGLC